MDNNFYEGYERLEDFTPDSLVAYRKHLLDKTQPQIEFIKKHVPSPKLVFEIGCGNGRLLIALASQKISESGFGIDLSDSRLEFAADWCSEWPLYAYQISFARRDVLSMKPADINPVDLAVCVTGCLQYFSDPKPVLDIMRRGKYALFELYNRPANSQSWHKLPTADRFAYLLDDYSQGNPTIHTKTFIKRDGTIDRREESLYYYTLPQVLELCKSAGFTQAHWAEENNEGMVILVS